MDIKIALPDEVVRFERTSFATLAIGYEFLIKNASEEKDIEKLKLFTETAQRICDRFWDERKNRLIGQGPEKKLHNPDFLVK